MNILLFSNLFPLPWEPRRGLFNARMASHLAEHHQLQVLVPVPWTVWRRQAPHARQPHHYSSAEHSGTEHGNIKVTPFPYFYLPGIWRWSYAATLALSAWRLLPTLAAARPDVMLATWLYPDAVAAMTLARRLRIPILLKAHGSDVNLHGRYPSRRAQMVRAARQAACTLTVSADLGRQLKGWGVPADKVRTLYNGVDPQRFFPQPRAHACTTLGVSATVRRLLYVGNLKASKGVLDLVMALGQLPASDWQQCVLIGDGPDRQRLQQLLVEQRLTDKVVLLGSQAPEHINLWLAASDLLILPSHAEGVPNVVLEAMAAGRPVVASALPGIREIVTDDCAVLVAPQQPARLAQGIRQALAWPWQQDAISTQAARFSWSTSTAALEQALSEAVAHYPPPP